MNSEFQAVIAAGASDRAGLFAETAQRLGTAPGNVEKDFWVCWTLDALFNGMPDTPRKLFKGGTALSKAFNLVKRFSEDVDVAIFRGDLGEDVEITELMGLTKGQRSKRLDKVKGACRGHIADTVLPALSAIVETAMTKASISSDQFSVILDSEDPDQQSVSSDIRPGTRRMHTSSRPCESS